MATKLSFPDSVLVSDDEAGWLSWVGVRVGSWEKNCVCVAVEQVYFVLTSV